MSSRKPGGEPAEPDPPGRAREFSAGGVMVRGREVAVIVPTRRAADGSETPVEAAAREVREETGLRGSLVCELGESRYWYRRNGRTIGKTVAFYMFDYEAGDVADHDDEVEDVRWIPLEEARRTLTYEGERQMVDRAIAYLDKDR